MTWSFHEITSNGRETGPWVFWGNVILLAHLGFFICLEWLEVSVRMSVGMSAYLSVCLNDVCVYLVSVCVHVLVCISTLYVRASVSGGWIDCHAVYVCMSTCIYVDIIQSLCMDVCVSVPFRVLL